MRKSSVPVRTIFRSSTEKRLRVLINFKSRIFLVTPGGEGALVMGAMRILKRGGGLYVLLNMNSMRLLLESANEICDFDFVVCCHLLR